MSTNILITGAAGYIGGSIVTDFVAKYGNTIGLDHIFAAVRSEDQAKAAAELGVTVLRLNLTDESSVIESILSHKIDIIIQTTSSIDPALSLPLITALAKLKENTGRQTTYIHTSGLSAFTSSTGWPADVTKDTDAIFETEKRLADSWPIRKTDVAVTEYAKELGVTSFIVVPSLVYGRGSGKWNQISVILPGLVNAAIRNKKVYKFDEDKSLGGVHITDLTALFQLIVDSVLRADPIPSGTEGYYVAIAHDVHYWETADHLAMVLKHRDLVADTQVEVWPNEEFAAESLEVPAQFVAGLYNSGSDFTAFRPASIGWKPRYDKKRFLESLDDEVVDALELGKAKSSLMESLRNFGKQ